MDRLIRDDDTAVYGDKGYARGAKKRAAEDPVTAFEKRPLEQEMSAIDAWRWPLIDPMRKNAHIGSSKIGDEPTSDRSRYSESGGLSLASHGIGRIFSFSWSFTCSATDRLAPTAPNTK